MYHFRKTTASQANHSFTLHVMLFSCISTGPGEYYVVCTACILQRAYRMAYANRATFVPINWNLSFYKQYNTWSFIKTSQKAYNRPRARTHTRYYLSRAIKQNVNFTIMLWKCCFNFSRTYIQRTKGEWCLYYKVQFLFKLSVLGSCKKGTWLDCLRSDKWDKLSIIVHVSFRFVQSERCVEKHILCGFFVVGVRRTGF